MADITIPLKELEAALEITPMLNIVRDYKWHTGLETDAPSSHVPRMLLREFEIANNSTFTGIKRTAAFLLSSVYGNNPYGGMYVCKATGLKIVLPYFNESVWKASVEWEDVDMGGENNKDKGGIEKGLKWISNVLQKGKARFDKVTQDLGQLNPFTETSNAIILNTQKAWKQGDAEGITTKFYLINTNSSRKSWYRNYNVCRYLKTICLHDQITATKASQPPIYEVFIPGYRYLPAAAITNVTIKQIGSVIPYHAIEGRDDGDAPTFSGGKFALESQEFYIPDAWEIELTVTPLVMASRQTEIIGLNEMRTEIAAITNTMGNAIDTAPYAPGDELGVQGGENEEVYSTRNSRNLFDLKNGTQKIGGINDGGKNRGH